MREKIVTTKGIRMLDLSPKSYSRAFLEEKKAIFSFRDEFFFLSNFYGGPREEGALEIYGIHCPTAEHAFAVAKLDPNAGVHPHEECMLEMRRIAKLEKPGMAKAAGRRRTWNGRPFLRPDWEKKKVELVTEIVRRKFRDPRLVRKLLATGERLLVEGNEHGDPIWGMVEKDDVFYGTNFLGEILMLIRSELRATSH